MGQSRLRGILNFCFARVRLSVGDVVEDCVVEEHGFLSDQRQLLSQAGNARVAQINSVPPNGAAGRIVKPRQQLGQGGFSATRLANQCDHSAGRHSKIDIAQYWASFLSITKSHITKFNLVSQRQQLDRVSLFTYLRMLVHNFPDVLRRGHGLRK